jgi:hypothetical protein
VLRKGAAIEIAGLGWYIRKMAIYHLSTKIISRSTGRSAVACASYRAGEELHDERLGRSFKFRREDRVIHAEIIAPASAPDWVSDRAQLWNSVEAAECRKDAQLSREFQIALPHELSRRQQRELVVGWVREQITPFGLVADACFHEPPIGDNPNSHLHLMTTTRSIDEEGNWSKTKDRSLNSPEQLEQWRSSWAKHANAALELAGYEDQQVDHRSHKRRGITNIAPTIHEGYAAQGIEERGERSWRVDINRQIRQTNRQIVAAIAAQFTQAAMAARRAAAAIGIELTPATQAPATKKPEPAPAPTVAKPEPIMPPLKPPIEVADDDAEERKKAAHRAAWIQRGGGGGVGG